MWYTLHSAHKVPFFWGNRPLFMGVWTVEGLWGWVQNPEVLNLDGGIGTAITSMPVFCHSDPCLFIASCDSLYLTIIKYEFRN